jgi:CRISPR-associated endonuclease/helicase Cas3
MAFIRDVFLSEAIRRHHGALQDLSEVRSYWINGDYADRVQELKPIYTWPGASALRLWQKVPHTWLDSLPSEDDWYDLCFDLLEAEMPADDPRAMRELWLDQRKIYGLLVAADRWDAAVGKEWQTEVLNIEPQRFQAYLHTITEKARP